MVIDMSKKRELKIGRGEECDIRFKHHSVSREHGIFRLNNNFKIVDLNSKFGTFIGLDFKKLSKGQNVLLMIDKWLLEIHPFKKTPCNCLKDKEHDDLIIDPFESEKTFLKNKRSSLSKPMKKQ